MKDQRSSIQNTLQASIAGLLAAGIAVSAGSVLAADPEKEKCLGISVAGKNDCGGIGPNSKHGCAGQAKVDKDPSDWNFVAKGSCEKMGGKLVTMSSKAKMDDKAMK